MAAFPKLKTWHWIILALVLVFVADWLAQRPDSRSRDINRELETHATAEMKAYPYQFRVFRVEGETAVLSSPRNFDVPALKFIRVIHPEINVMNANDPAFIAAETDLAHRQMEARAIVLAHPGIKDVKWELDRHWLMSHGVDVPDKR